MIVCGNCGARGGHHQSGCFVPVQPIWCSACWTHMASPTVGLCPICLDDQRTEQESGR